VLGYHPAVKVAEATETKVGTDPISGVRKLANAPRSFVKHMPSNSYHDMRIKNVCFDIAFS